jgi:hypothetical protein
MSGSTEVRRDEAKKFSDGGAFIAGGKTATLTAGSEGHQLSSTSFLVPL